MNTSKFNHLETTLAMLGHLGRSMFTIRGAVRLQTSSCRPDSWQRKVILDVHAYFDLKKPNKYLLEYIYMFAKMANHTHFSEEDPEGDVSELIFDIADSFAQKFGLTDEQVEKWARDEDSLWLTRYVGDLPLESYVNLAVVADRIRDHGEDIGEVLLCAIDDYLDDQLTLQREQDAEKQSAREEAEAQASIEPDQRTGE